MFLVNFFPFSCVFENIHNKVLAEIFEEIHVAVVDDGHGKKSSN